MTDGATEADFDRKIRPAGSAARLLNAHEKRRRLVKKPPRSATVLRSDVVSSTVDGSAPCGM